MNGGLLISLLAALKQIPTSHLFYPYGWWEFAIFSVKLYGKS